MCIRDSLLDLGELHKTAFFTPGTSAVVIFIHDTPELLRKIQDNFNNFDFTRGQWPAPAIAVQNRMGVRRAPAAFPHSALHQIREIQKRQIDRRTVEVYDSSRSAFRGFFARLIRRRAKHDIVGGDVYKRQAQGRIVPAASPSFTAQCSRVPASDGHMGAVFASFDRLPPLEELSLILIYMCIRDRITPAEKYDASVSYELYLGTASGKLQGYTSLGTATLKNNQYTYTLGTCTVIPAERCV